MTGKNVYAPQSGVIPIPGSNPTSSGFAQNYDFNQEIPGMNEDLSQYGINVDGAISPQQGGSWYDSIMGAGSMGKGGFMSSLPGYAISAFSAYDQNKTNKLNRKATQYSMDRKKTEDKAYDDYRKSWGNVKFAPRTA